MSESTVQPESDPPASDAAESSKSQRADPSATDSLSLSAMIRHLLQECPSKQAVYDTLMKVCQQRLATSVVRADYRMGAVIRSEIRHDSRLPSPAARKFSDKYLAQVAQEVRTSPLQEPQFKRFERGDQQMLIAAAPIFNITSNKIDGVLTVMLSGSSHRPEFVLPILDGIAATAAAVMVSRAIAASKGAQPTSIRAETAKVVEGRHSAPAASPPVVPAPTAKSPVSHAAAPAAGVSAAAGAMGATQTVRPVQANPQPAQVQASASAPSPAVAPAAAINMAASTEAARSQAAALSNAGRFSNLKEFGFTLVNSISNEFQCEQVAFGVEEGSRAKVHAISGIADFKASSPGVDSIRQAMEECLDDENAITVPGLPAVGEAKAVAARSIHQQWSTECNNSAVCSLPLFEGDKVVAVVSLRRANSRPFSHADIARLRKMLESYGPAVRVVERAGQPVGSRIKSAVKTSASSTMKKGAWGRRIVLFGMLAATLWFCFGTMTYEPLCRSTITAANLRHFSAPFNGQLKAVRVTPGQRVSAGDVLVEFDTSELKLEYISLLRQIAATDVQVKQAVSDRELGQASMANIRLPVLHTELHSVRKRIEEATIKAPSDGVVVLADLQQRIGQEFPQGEEILQFVADGDWLLEIEIPDSLVNVVSTEQTGTFAPASDPTNKHEFQIETVDGAASVIEDRNVFLAHAGFPNQPSQMMTGMEGTCQLTTVDKPVWWVALHGAIDWARMNYWL